VESAVLRPSLSLATTRALVVCLQGRGKSLPCPRRGSFALRIRELRIRAVGPPFPSEVESGSAVGETGQDVVGRHIAVVAYAVHVPAVRRSQGDDRPRPIPTILGLLEIFENDGQSCPFADLPPVRFVLQAR